MFSYKGIFVIVALLWSIGILSAQAYEWEWALQSGGIGQDRGNSIAADSQGNHYVTGSCQSPISFGLVTVPYSGGTLDIFVARLDSAGNCLWAIGAGGDSNDAGNSIAVDDSANVYITGTFQGTAVFGSITLTANGEDDENDIFVAKLDCNGNFLWAVKMGDTGADSGNDITVDAAANVYVTGQFHGTAVFGSTSLTSSGWNDIFVAKLDTNGNFIWAVQAGGPIYFDSGGGIAVDTAANVYLTGGFQETASFGTITLTSYCPDHPDLFIAKLDSSGTFLWAVGAGADYYDSGNAIVLDSENNVCVTGSFEGNVTFGSITLSSSAGSLDIYVAKLDNNGNFIWVVKAGGNNNYDDGVDIAVDAEDYLYVTGDFAPGAMFGSIPLSSNGVENIYVAKMDSSGNFLWAVKAEGSDMPNVGMGIAVDAATNVYVIGKYWGIGTFGSITIGNEGCDDIFVAKLSSGEPVADNVVPAVSSLSHLYNAYPNPLRASETATIKAEIADSETGTLTIFNQRGQIISSRQLNPGMHDISISSSDLPAGVYLYKLQTRTLNAVKKVVLIK